MPVDVIETDAVIDQTTHRQKGIAGSTIIRDRTTLIADVFEMVDAVYPEWGTAKTATPAKAAGKGNLSGKTLIDIANPLDASQGFPPTLAFCNEESLGERIQAAFPDARVVKTLNTMNCQVMVEPTRVPGEHAVFMSGDDDGA
jgi:hypothetical protein